MKGIKNYLILLSTLLVVIVGAVSFDEKKVNATTAVEVLDLAATQEGYKEKASKSKLDNFTANAGSGNYTKYARDVGIGNPNPWCAAFVWWCMNKSGVSYYPKSALCTTVQSWFVSNGSFHKAGKYTPKPGDYILFKSNAASAASKSTPVGHVGIVVSVTASKVKTIEGNTSNAVAYREYSLSAARINGYGEMDYTANDADNKDGETATSTAKPAESSSKSTVTETASPTSTPVVNTKNNPSKKYAVPTIILKKGMINDQVKWVQEGLNVIQNSKLSVDGDYGKKTKKEVIKFQKKYKLEADGEVGKLTRNKMKSVWKSLITNKVTTKISSLKAKDTKIISVGWKKADAIKGYQIQYCSDKKMTKDSVKKLVKKNTTVKKNISVTESGKKYFFRIRTYKLLNGKKVLSSWSAVKNVKSI